MCNNLKIIFKNVIEHEKNIHVRERQEARISRAADVIILLLTAGTLFSNVEFIFSAIYKIASILIFISLYILFEGIILARYAVYTDKLIKQSNS